MTTSKSESETNGVQKKTGTDSKQRSKGTCDRKLLSGWHLQGPYVIQWFSYTYNCFITKHSCLMLPANPSLWHTSLDQLVPPLGGPILQNSALAYHAPLPKAPWLKGLTTEAKYWAQFVSPCHHFHKPLPNLESRCIFRKTQPLFGDTHYKLTKKTSKKPFLFSGSTPQFPPSIKHGTGALGGSSSGSCRASGGSSTDSLSAIEEHSHGPTLCDLKKTAALGAVVSYRVPAFTYL